MDTGLTVTDLAAFTGQDASYYGAFVDEAIAQAEDLFELATGLTALPDPGLLLRLARRGVLAMAEAIYEGQQYRSLRFAPFKTQTIGSYSYAIAEKSVLSGVPTGVAWFDLAVRRLAVVGVVSNVSTHAFDRPGDVVREDGEYYLVGPADRYRGWGHGDSGDPTSGYSGVDASWLESP